MAALGAFASLAFSHPLPAITKLSGPNDPPLHPGAPFTAPVKATPAGRPSADLDRRGRRAFLSHVGSGENAAFRLTRENDFVRGSGPLGRELTHFGTVGSRAGFY